MCCAEHRCCCCCRYLLLSCSADIPMLVAGDFNSIPGSAAHSLLVKGRVEPSQLVSTASRLTRAAVAAYGRMRIVHASCAAALVRAVCRSAGWMML